MKPILVKVAVGVASLALAYGVWYLLVVALRNSGNPLQHLTFWVSPLSFTGWILFLVLWVLIYLGLRKFGPGFLAG